MTDNVIQTPNEIPVTETTSVPAATASTTESSGVPIAGTATIPNAISGGAATAPITVTPPLTKEQHETLLQRIAEMPLEIGAWLKKELKLAEADIEKI